ncbi:MAG: DNA topoisomerase I [Candidatus Bathyarchaeota archaeon]
MRQLIHNGVMVPPPYEAQGLTVKIKGREHRLTPVQEERAVAWAKKIGTPYVEDPVFADNFHRDFSDVLGFKVRAGDVDYTDIYRLVLAEREHRQNLPNEEKKRLRDQRKAEREANKEMYGYAVIDGERCELGNYIAEPSSIFMGRGQHPFRGKWKEGPRHSDIELNLSPGSPRPPGDWKTVVWDPVSMWIARWKDKLTDKMKYVWPHDSSPIKQRKEVEKFDKAIELRRNLGKVQRHIMENLTSPDIRRRKTATVCYLIDELNFRVGDEKDEDEADTVGASSLRTEHITFNQDGTVTFDFLGKDSVPLNLTARLDPRATANLREFAEMNSGGPLFEEVNSSVVSEFLDEVMEGVTAKVFRTCHATEAVERRLQQLEVNADEPEYRKKHVATLANLEAAVTCNHKRTIPKTWEQGLIRQVERQEQRKRKARDNIAKYKQRIQDTTRKYEERIANYEAKVEEDRAKLQELKEELKTKEQGKSTKGIRSRVESKQKGVRATRERIQQTKSKHREAVEKLKQQMEERRRKDQEMIEKYGLQLEAKELTRDYNLGTSLKSYVDPRVYYEWGHRVGYDWRSYYSNTLVKKFSWVDPEPEEADEK